MTQMCLRAVSIAVVSALFVGCGGGGSDSGSSTSYKTPPSNPVAKNDANAIVATPDPIEIIANAENITVDPNANSDDKVTTTSEVPIDKTVLNRLNERRLACGFGQLSISKKLTDAATNHSRYLMYMGKNSDEQFQGHYEIDVNDGYSGNKNPYYSGKTIENRIHTDAQIGTQALAVNYEFNALGENLSFLSYNEAYAKRVSNTNIALNSINGLLAAPYHLASLISPNFSQVGIGYASGALKQPIALSNGTVEAATGSVLEVVSARPKSQNLPTLDKVISYPCNGVTDTAYELTNESPNPFKGTSRNLQIDPIGQPIYILGPKDIQVSAYIMLDASQKEIPLQPLTKDNDPNGKLQGNEVILMPLTALQPDNIYTVSYRVSMDNGAIQQDKSFWFKTKAKTN